MSYVKNNVKQASHDVNATVMNTTFTPGIVANDFGDSFFNRNLKDGGRIFKFKKQPKPPHK